MEYRVGQQMMWMTSKSYEYPMQVQVVELKSRGHAKLSNGWVVDEDGYAEGTLRQPGGFVTPIAGL